MSDTPPWSTSQYGVYMTFLEHYINMAFAKAAEEKNKARLTEVRLMIMNIDPPIFSNHLIALWKTFMSPEQLEKFSPDALAIEWARETILDMLDVIEEAQSVRDLWRKCSVSWKKYQLNRAETPIIEKSEEIPADDKCNHKCPYHC